MIHRLRDSVRVLLGRRRFEADMDAELRAHIELAADDWVRRGLPRAEALRRARAAFGALDGAKDAAREARGIRWADELAGDLRYALRMLRKSPGYAAVAIATLALGIGANTAIFSVVDGVLLKPLPYPESHRLVQVAFGYPLGALWTYRPTATSYTGVAAYEYLGELNLFVNGAAERIKGRAVSAEFFDVLGVTPVLGRTFRPGEDGPGAPKVAVISEGLWRRRFGADATLLGKTIAIDGTPREVIGVVGKDFAFPAVGTDVWTTILLDPKLISTVWGAQSATLIGRLKPGITVAEAHAEHRALIPVVRESFPFDLPDIWGTAPGNRVQALDVAMGQAVSSRLRLLLAAVGVVLLIACVNVANLNLTRLAGREREVAVRQALGGSRLRVARQLLVEQLVVATAGGIAGVGLAIAATPLLVRWLPPDTPRLDQIGLDPRVLAFTGLVILVAAMLASVGPLVRLPRAGRVELLGAAGRGASAGATRHRMLGALVATEVALSVVLVIGAAILVRSLARLLSVDPGVVVEQITTARVTPNPTWCEDEAGPCTCTGTTCRAFFPALEERLAALPGVRGVALGSSIPLDGGYYSFPMDIEDHPIPPGGAAFLLGSHTVSPGYFDVLGIPLLEGRAFTRQDRGPENPVVIVNQALARRFWPDRSAIGKHIKPVWMPKMATIVGVVGNARYEGLSRDEASFDFYMPMEQWSVGAMTVALKTSLPANTMETTLRREVTAVDPTATVIQVRPMQDVLLASAAPSRMTTVLIGLFATIALALGTIGVYGVLSYGVTQRRREIGIRMAIGAEPGEVRALVMRRAAKLLAGGVIVGLLGAWLGASVLESFVYGIGVRDPLTFAAVPVLFLLVGLGASWLPARRATRVSPTEVMREE